MLLDTPERISLFSTVISTLVTLVLLGIMLYVLVFFSTLKAAWHHYRSKKHGVELN